MQELDNQTRAAVQSGALAVLTPTTTIKGEHLAQGMTLVGRLNEQGNRELFDAPVRLGVEKYRRHYVPPTRKRFRVGRTYCYFDNNGRYLIPTPSTTCRDCGTGLTLDVAQEYQLCSMCEMIAGVDDAMSMEASK